MKKYYFLIIFPFSILLIALVVYSNTSKVDAPRGVVSPPEKNLEKLAVSENNIENNTSPTYYSPLEKSRERAAQKTFGMYITRENSPVQPERFEGYHTGTDFEILPEELNATISVKAICQGKLITKKYVSGYGGVAVESCSINNQPVTVIYGHLKLLSITNNIGDQIKAGDIAGILGADKSTETDGERKHLHLGIHKGTDINIKGYVQNKAELSDWLDPCLFVCHD